MTTTATTFTKGYKVTLYSDSLRATSLYSIYINDPNLGCPRGQCEYVHYTLVFDSQLRNRRQLFLSQVDYVKCVLERFNMRSVKSSSTLLPISLRLSQRDCPTSGLDGEIIKSIPYASIVDSLMYAMVATWPDIAHVIGAINSLCITPTDCIGTQLSMCLDI